MVFIKRVDIRGFKTFGKKASISFDRGLTVITGPNGAGKSNILDSVKFALGELSPKEMRGETISDLIHKGVQPAHSAYVAIQFDNHDRRIPVDAEQVTVSREFRKNGEGIYRLNGRKISRKQLADVLSPAGVQVSSYNIVPQHAITRLADVTPEERRKIIEDMIGIGVYDDKKAASQAELQQADLNLRVGTAKIDEVRLRVESLVKERNDYLRYMQIRKEIGQLQAKVTSNKIRNSELQLVEVNELIDQHQKQIHALKTQREELTQNRARLESEKSSFEDSLTPAGGGEILQIQQTIGEITATITNVKAQIKLMHENRASLEKRKLSLHRSMAEMTAKLTGSRKEIRDMRIRRRSILENLASKRAQVNSGSEELAHLRRSLGESVKEEEAIEGSLKDLTERLIKFTAQSRANTIKKQLLENHQATLTARRDEHQRLVETVTKRVEQLHLLRESEVAHAKDVEGKISRYRNLKVKREQGLENAGKLAKNAVISLAELESQRKLAETAGSEDRALRLIENMVATGQLAGVHGTIGSLIKFEGDHSRAIEASAAGWLKALIVKDVSTAISCIEVLKKTRVGRLKIIPLEILRAAHKPKLPSDLQGLMGAIIDYISYPPEVANAVEYVFGDTVLTVNARGALMASLAGIRAVALTGDLYELGGAMETGYYRQPFDFSKLFAKDAAINKLKALVPSLDELLSKSKEELVTLMDEISDQVNLQAKVKGTIAILEREIATFSREVDHAQKIVEDTQRRMQLLEREIGTEETILQACLVNKETIQSTLTKLQENLRSARSHTRSVALIDREDKQAELSNQLNEMMAQKADIETRIESLTESLSIIEPSMEELRLQVSAIDDQLDRISSDLDTNQIELRSLEDKLKGLESERDILTSKISDVKVKREDYSAHLAAIDERMRQLLDQLDNLSSETTQLTATSKQLQTQIEFHLNELKEHGYSTPIEFTEDDILEAESVLDALRKELESIGGVNELSVAQYEEVKENYKHLASRIYELEKEKMSIIEFMNELDRQKCETFMKAFNQVNESFNKIFSAVTSGRGRLQLEQPDNPFEEGVDIKLQFVGKAEMNIGSVSGGEKSVGTVCFLLALQAIHPMPFYMLDEIDAHLDVVNSQRLAELLKEKSRGSQFIVNSLKDVTVARADAVYGVFMQHGISQVIRLPVQEAVTAGKRR